MKKFYLIIVCFYLISGILSAQTITCSQLFPDSTIPHLSMGGNKMGWVTRNGNHYAHHYMDTLLNVSSFQDTNLIRRVPNITSGGWTGNYFCGSTMDKNGNLIGLFFDDDCFQDTLQSPTGSIAPGFICHYWYDYATQQKTYFSFLNFDQFQPILYNSSGSSEYSYKMLWSGDTLILLSGFYDSNAPSYHAVCLKFLNLNLIESGNTGSNTGSMLKCFIDYENKINTLYVNDWLQSDGVNYNNDLAPGLGFHWLSDASKDSLGNIYIKSIDSLRIKNNASDVTITAPATGNYDEQIICTDHLNRLWMVSDDTVSVYTNNTWSHFPMNYNNFDNYIWYAAEHNTFFEYAPNKFVLTHGTDVGIRGGNGMIFFTFNDTAGTVPTPNHVAGHVFYDANNNSIQDSGEQNLSNLLVSAGSNSAVTFNNGNYNLYLPFGSHNLQLNNSNPNFSVNPTNHALNFTGPSITDTSGIDFMLQAASPVNDVNINIFNIHQNVYYGYHTIVYSNTGTASANGVITYNFDASLTPNDYSINPTTTAPGMLTFNYSNLMPFESRTIYILFLTNGLAVGDTTISTASITPLVGDATPTNNSDTITKIVSGSYDPNSKDVIQNGTSVNTIYNDDYLEYVIHFQNVGNDTAFTVIVRDTLDMNLDINTLQFIGASHSQSMLLNSRIIEFTFNNINLVDSGTNFAASQGFVAFRIKPLNNLSLGAQINNTAAIYFDLNSPIITNNVQVTMSSFTSLQNKTGENEIQIYPNPASNLLVVDVQKTKGLIVIKDIIGNIVMSKNIDNSKMRLDLSQLNNGVYFVCINNQTLKKIVVNK